MKARTYRLLLSVAAVATVVEVFAAGHKWVGTF
jgi:hypothetical protein